jgi:hypothetical protein
LLQLPATEDSPAPRVARMNAGPAALVPRMDGAESEPTIGAMSAGEAPGGP